MKREKIYMDNLSFVMTVAEIKAGSEDSWVAWALEYAEKLRKEDGEKKGA